MPKAKPPCLSLIVIISNLLYIFKVMEINAVKKKDFLALLEEIIEADKDTLSGNEFINDIDGWDSLAVVSFIAMIDENFGVTLPAQKISEAKTIQDLINLLGDKIIE